MPFRTIIALCASLAILVVPADASVTAPMRLTSPAFRDGGAMPRRHTCRGSMVSPLLAWSGVPAGTRELELLVTDASFGDFSHWVVYAIPPAAQSSAEGAAPEGSKQGSNGVALDGYFPACPIGLSPHKYVFELFASKQALSLPKQPSDHDVRAALQGKVLATATLTGTYTLGD